MDFMSAYLAGWSVLSLMCLIIGLGLMIAEMFTPGLGLMGMFGIIALIAAIVLSAHSLLDAIFTLAIIFVVLFIAGFIVYRSFTKGRLANSSIVLSDRIDSASTSLDDAEIQGIVGKEGITTTALRPCYQIAIHRDEGHINERRIYTKGYPHNRGTHRRAENTGQKGGGCKGIK